MPAKWLLIAVLLGAGEARTAVYGFATERACKAARDAAAEALAEARAGVHAVVCMPNGGY